MCVVPNFGIALSSIIARADWLTAYSEHTHTPLRINTRETQYFRLKELYHDGNWEQQHQLTPIVQN